MRGACAGPPRASTARYSGEAPRVPAKATTPSPIQSRSRVTSWAEAGGQDCLAREEGCQQHARGDLQELDVVQHPQHRVAHAQVRGQRVEGVCVPHLQPRYPPEPVAPAACLMMSPSWLAARMIT